MEYQDRVDIERRIQQAVLDVMARMELRLQHTAQGDVRGGVKRPVIQQGPLRTFPFGQQYVFGLLVAGNQVKVYNPMLRRYGDPQGTAPNQTICYTCADTTITFAGDGTGQRICWKWDPTGGLAILPNAQTNDPIDDGTYIYGVVAIFDVTNLCPTIAVGGVVQCGQIITLPVFTVAGS